MLSDKDPNVEGMTRFEDRPSFLNPHWSVSQRDR